MRNALPRFRAATALNYRETLTCEAAQLRTDTTLSGAGLVPTKVMIIEMACFHSHTGEAYTVDMAPLVACFESAKKY